TTSCYTSYYCSRHPPHLHSFPTRRSSDLGLDAHADDHVHRPRRAARHVSLRRGGAGFGVAPQPERALQRGDGHRALTSPRADATVTNENNRRDAHMDHFTYRNFDLCCEQVSLRSLAADVGTP